MILGIFRLTTYLLFTLVLLPVQMLLVAIGHKGMNRLPQFYHQVTLKIFGITVEVVGTPAPAPLLLVGNHISYLDIPVLGSIMPLCFVAKKEVASWPGYGLLAKLQRTVFIDRRPAMVSEGQSAITKRLSEDKLPLVLFPEGTSSDGTRILPFRRAMFQAAIDQAGEVTLQPFALSVVGMEGLPADRVAKQTYGYYGDIALAPHLWMFAQIGSSRIRVTFLPPLDLEVMQDRAQLARMAEEAVNEAFFAA